MGEARRYRAMRAILQIREAEHLAARTELASAERAERDALDASDRADDRMAAASRSWDEHLAGGGFWPELAQFLAGRLLEQAGESDAARQRAAAAGALRIARETGWYESDMRQRQAERLLAVSRRALLREREEHALEAAADRVSYAWSRR